MILSLEKKSFGHWFVPMTTIVYSMGGKYNHENVVFFLEEWNEIRTKKEYVRCS